MKTLAYLVVIALVTLVPQLRAQDADAEALPVGSTVVTSDELRSDQINHVATFTGNVTVRGTNFTMTCEEMTVNFNKEGHVDVITAKGNVVINQPGRVTHSGQAQYFRDEDKFILTDSPSILDNNNQLEAPIITIYRTKQTVITSGGKSKYKMTNSGIGSTTTPPPAGTP